MIYMTDGLDKESETLKQITSKFKVKGNVQRERRVWIDVNKDKLLDVCKFIKNIGYNHLSAISVTDRLKDNEYELTYHIWSYSDKILITIRTRIDRNNPVIKSVVSIWDENAQIHEREMHEMFGVKFEGNNDLSPLFLEDWKEAPPFRKDFDWRNYVRERFYNKENEREKPYFLGR